MIGSLDDPRILARIGNACGEAAEGVRDLFTRGAHEEAEGQAGPHEEDGTRELADAVNAIDALGDLLTEKLNPGETGSDGHEIHIRFETHKARQGQENDFGLDLGIRIIIETPGYSSNKAILIQCKRMYGVGAKGKFTKLRGDGETQARKMLSVTPASFFFLFNSGGRDELVEMLRSPYPPFPRLFRPPAYSNPGVTVLSAARVLAMADGAKGGPLPIDAADVLPASVPLGEFIAGVFAPCLVGDVRLPVLRLATPPGRHGQIAGGLEADVPTLPALEPKRFYELHVSEKGAGRDRDRPGTKQTG